MGPEWLVRAVLDMWPAPLPDTLEPTTGTSQCSYELLRAFVAYAKSKRLRFTLGAGTLLGAMRNHPSGLLQWEHDVDVYMPARDASHMISWLERDCSQRHHRSRWCRTLHFPGLVDRSGQPCCGWGFKLYHQETQVCELDVLVLAVSHTPFMHGETRLWPFWGPLLATPYHDLAVAWQRLSMRHGSTAPVKTFFVIPEDVRNKCLMGDHSRWCPTSSPLGEWAWCGTPLSFFQDEYLEASELFPLREVRFHGMAVTVPSNSWAVLNRTYGGDCGHIARLSEHAGARADLRHPENSHLRRPAQIERLPVWRTSSSQWRRQHH